MKLSKLFIAGLAIFGFTACSEETEIGSSKIDIGNVISVSTYIPGTRAMDKTSFVEGDVLSLYSCLTTRNYGNSFTGNFMNNVEVTRTSGGDWTYSPLMAWPTDANEHLSFIAYYPKNTSSTPMSYYYTVNDNFTEQNDPLWCTIKDASINDRNGTAINGNESDAAFEATSGALNLKFKHMLSKVNVKVKLASNYPGITCKLNELTLSDVSPSGTFTIANDLSSGYWSRSGSKSFTLTSGAEDVLSSTEYDVAEMLMIPQDLSEQRAYFLIKYTHTLAEGGEKTVTKKIYIPNKWEMGKVYNYVINLSLDVNTISLSTEINNWDSTENPNIGTKAADPVDLGLRVKWASYDFGTVSPYDDGPGYDYYDSRDFTLTDTWGANWHIPTYEEWKELIDKCKITSMEKNGKTIYVVEGTNGNKIYFPSSDYWVPKDTGYPSYYPYCASLSNPSVYSLYSLDKDVKHPIRPVYTK